MGGIFGVASKSDCVMDLFFGIDYHSHLGTRRGGMTVYSRSSGFNRVIHNIENSPFRTKFDKDVAEMEGNLGIGCISDNEPQPLLVRSHLGNFAITTVGKINNIEALVEKCFKDGHTHFLEMSGGSVNPTEVTAALINQKDSIVEGIRYAQEMIEGSMTLLLMTTSFSSSRSCFLASSRVMVVCFREMRSRIESRALAALRFAPNSFSRTA